jgi:hypothetical protein
MMPWSKGNAAIIMVDNNINRSLLFSLMSGKKAGYNAVSSKGFPEIV